MKSGRRHGRWLRQSRQQRWPLRFLDQDALNLVAADRQMPMSLAWNFPIFMRNSGVESTMEPIIYHFMSNPKPWHGAFRPWTSDFHRPYVEIIQKYPEIAPYLQTLPNVRRLKYLLQQHYKNQTERLTWALAPVGTAHPSL